MGRTTDGRDERPAGGSSGSGDARVLGGVLMAALVLGALEASLISWWQRSIGEPLSPLQHVPILLTWLLLAALVPAVAWLARRVPLFAPPPLARPDLRAAVIHVAGAIAFAAVHLGGSAVLQRVAQPDAGIWGAVRFQLAYYMALDLLVYAAIVGGTYTLVFRREAAERALAEAELRQSLTTARLDALRAQLQPHFLFNTLNTISTMSLRAGDSAVSDALGRLGALLRASLDDAAEREIPLERELAVLEDYLAIQRARFGDRLTVEREIGPGAHDALVPPFLLQPLLENAVRHGVEERPAGGRIQLRASRRNGRLHVQVIDDGAAESPGRESAIRSRAAAHDTAGRGLGLGATRERLRQLYGSDQSLELISRARGGTEVRVTLPFRSHAAEARGA